MPPKINKDTLIGIAVVAVVVALAFLYPIFVKWRAKGGFSATNKAPLVAGSNLPPGYDPNATPEPSYLSEDGVWDYTGCPQCPSDCSPTIWPFSGCEIHCGAKCGDTCCTIGVASQNLAEMEEFGDQADEDKEKGDMGSDLGAPEAEGVEIDSPPLLFDI